jgi:murein DD-endopeptidase MepM/ murein hydrolase activator NlpD
MSWAKVFLAGFLSGVMFLCLVLFWAERRASALPAPGQPPPAGAAPPRAGPALPPTTFPTPAPPPVEVPWPELPPPGASAEPPEVVPGPAPGLADYESLLSRELLFPLDGQARRALVNNFAETRGDRTHEALDILAPRGTPVLAVDGGVVRKLFMSVRGGLTVYQFDPTESYCYYYAHLDRYAEGLVEGKVVRKGDRIGYVGTTGNAPPNTPHLHFTIFKLGPEKRWWEGVPINPFPLWAPAAG